MKFSNRWKFAFVFICFVASVAGFMIKLPAVFRHANKELHMLFYFLAAAVLNILFAKNNLLIHILILVILFLFGISIEYAQAYSNKLLHAKIHGRYDPEDVKSNCKGLLAFSAVWITYTLITLLYKKATVKNTAVDKT